MDYAQKLSLLADWFYEKNPDNQNDEVQIDLREIAEFFEKYNYKVELVYNLQKATEKLLELISSYPSGPELNLATEHAYRAISSVRVKFRKDFNELGINNDT